MKRESPFKYSTGENQTAIIRNTDRDSLYKPSQGWIAGHVKIDNHTRYNKAYPDAEARLEIAGGNGNGVTLQIDETTETKAGPRTTTAHVALTMSNTRALRDMLTEMIEAEERAAAQAG